MNRTASSLNIPAIKDYFNRQKDVVVAYLFGSFARDQADLLSDVDIAVLLNPDLDLESLLERQLQLVLALEAFVDCEVQVTILNHVAPLLAYRVLREGVLLYEQDRTVRVNFEVYTLKRYFDVKPMLEFFHQNLLKRIQEVGIGRRRRRSTRTLEAARRIHERLTSISGR